MAMIKCTECGREVSTKAIVCPGCGAQVKKKMGFLSKLFGGFLIFLSLGFVVFLFDSDKKEIETKQHVKENKKPPETPAQNLEQTLEKLNREVKALPADAYEKRLAIYKKMVQLSPENEAYKGRIIYYTEELTEHRDLIARFGEKPENSPWDGSVACVKDYIKSTARDPASLEFEKWGVVSSAAQGWTTWCQYRGKNAFGGYVKETKDFIIRNNKVVSMSDKI